LEGSKLREHWRDVNYWRWLWHRHVPFEAKVSVGVVLTGLMLGGGWFAADRLTAAHAGTTGTRALVLERTVRKVVVVTEGGKVIRKLVPVVTRVKVRQPGKTSYQTRTTYKSQVVTTPGSVRVVPRVVTTFAPVVKKRVVRVNGKTHTVVETLLAPTIRTETQSQTQTQTQTHEVTNVQTVTNTQNVVQTETVSQTKTITLPAVTTTVTNEVTTTVINGVTTTVTNEVTTTVTNEETTTVTSETTVTTTVTRPPKP
jgi:hypothetical protein